MEEKIRKFKDDLHLETKQLVQKYITTGTSAVLDEDLLFSLKKDVSDFLEIHPNEVILVGSAKVGFSLAPSKRYRAFGDQSDLDVAIISHNLFDKIWRSVLEYKYSGRLWDKEREFENYFFHGWMRPDKLPPSERFEFAKQWWEYFSDLRASEKFGPYKIAGGIYRTWEFLDSYQSVCIEKCKNEGEF
ncbi:hypothetical protein [Burkholderia vietnamiensis]|uniref:hypothetical protein n=1 Tax=Burkholderia vietnamiensis TaxID=60552 RepID=UPI0012D9FFFD|nr:hypothetical protein [Burkholderia vietnamiensis]